MSGSTTPGRVAGSTTPGRSSLRSNIKQRSVLRGTPGHDNTPGRGTPKRTPKRPAESLVFKEEVQRHTGTVYSLEYFSNIPELRFIEKIQSLNFHY